MYINYANDIKSRISMIDVCRIYGIEINRQNKAVCPFHADRRPSMHVYDGERGYWCYTCNSGGSVIDFVMRYFNLDFQSACKKLNDDFTLGLPFGQPLTVAQYKKVSQEAEQHRIKQLKRKKHREKLSEAYNTLMDLWVKLDNIKREKAPRHSQGSFDEDYAYALKHIDYVSYMLDNVLCEMHKLGI